MSSFPKNRHEMERMGYRKTGDAVCKGCGANIEWWKTTAGKPIPYDPIRGDYDAAVAHWATCPNAKDFKGAASTPDAPPPAKYTPEQQVRLLRDRTNARVVVLTTDDGTYSAWRTGIPAEELRQDLISAGNFVRNEIQKQEAAKS
jgi:hypothetical protein